MSWSNGKIQLHSYNKSKNCSHKVNNLLTKTLESYWNFIIHPDWAEMFLWFRWHVIKKHFIKSWTPVQAGQWFCPLITWTRPTCWVTASPSSPKDSCIVADPRSSSRTVSGLVSIWHLYAGWRISRRRRWGWHYPQNQPETQLGMHASSAFYSVIIFFTHRHTHTYKREHLAFFHESFSFWQDILNCSWCSCLFPAERLRLCLRLLLFLLHLYQIQRSVSEPVPASRQSSGW